MIEILVFGTGSVAYRFIHIIDFEKVHVSAFVNSNASIKQFEGIRVIEPKDINSFKYDYIVIASGYTTQISNILIRYGVRKDKIVSFIYDEIETYKEIKETVNDFIDKKYNRHLIKDWVKTDVHISEFYPAIFWKGEENLECVEKDFVREQLVKLVALQIEKNNVHGAIAECGVFRGDFTIVIDRVFSNKIMYLFDSFEGFSQSDIKQDLTIKNDRGESDKFKETSEEFVLERLHNKSNKKIIKKGYFPDSFDLINEKFSFVSIDFNLYKPVKDALDIFYKNLEKGGYILVSDYSAPFYEGSKKAVDEWCRVNEKNIIPIPDFYGSVIIVKE